MMAYQPQGPVYNPPQQQIVTVSSGNPNIQAHFNSIGSRRTGWLQLVCGCICVLLGIIAIFIKCYMSGGYFPIWSGLLFFITPGIAGIMAAKSRTSCAITAFLVLSIIAALFSFCLIWVMLGAAVAEAAYTPCREREKCDDWGYCHIESVCSKHDSYITSYMVLSIFASLFSFCLVWVMLSSTLVDVTPRDCKAVRDCSDSDSDSDYSSNCSVSMKCMHAKGYEACVAIDVILLFAAQTEFIVSIISAAICCRGVCCKGGGSKSTSYTTVSQSVPAGTTVVIEGQAGGAYTVAPSAPQQSFRGGYPPAAGAPAAPYPPPPADPAYPPVTGEKPPYPDATAPSAPALDQPPTYEQSVG